LYLEVSSKIGDSQTLANQKARVLEVVPFDEVEYSLDILARGTLLQRLLLVGGIEPGKDLSVEYACTFAGILVVVVQVLLDFGPATFVPRTPLLLQFVLAHQIVHDGVALAQVESVLGVKHGRHFPHGVHLLVLLGQVLREQGVLGVWPLGSSVFRLEWR
jgi:hypothetical protein